MQQKGALEPVTLLPLNETLGFRVIIAPGTAPWEALRRGRMGLEHSIPGTSARERESCEGQNADVRNQGAGRRGNLVPYIQDPQKMSPASAPAISQQGNKVVVPIVLPRSPCSHTPHRVSGNTFAILEDFCCCSKRSSFLITPPNNEP